MKNSNLNYLFAVIILAAIITTSCSSDDNSPEAVEVASERTIDTKLAGTWNGTVDGTLGSAQADFILGKNGDISAETDSEILCPFQGTWWVQNGIFNAAGEDECDGTVIELRGSNTSSVKITGNWTASSGNNGTFSMTKQ
jgi:hypothetical protein